MTTGYILDQNNRTNLLYLIVIRPDGSWLRCSPTEPTDGAIFVWASLAELMRVSAGLPYGGGARRQYR